MFHSKEQTRIGDLLVSRGIISYEQLNTALETQKQRRNFAIHTSNPVLGSIALGEILCELGYIDHATLKRHLKRQGRLRKVALMMALLAPLLSPLTAMASKDKLPTTKTAAVKLVKSKNHIGPADDEDSYGQGASSVAGHDTRTGTLNLNWKIPDSRNNGQELEVYEIGGYEILYKKKGDALYYSEVIADPQQTHTQLKKLEPGDYEIMFASYDINGEFSSYSTMHVKVN